MDKLKKYERMAADFEQTHQLNGYHHFRRLEIVLSFLRKLGKDLIILDAGCGDGLQLDKYIKSYTAFGVDISLTRLKRAKDRVSRNVVFSGDLFKLPIKDNKFDVVILGEVIEHLEEPRVVLREIHRILKSTGYILLDTPSQSNIIDMILNLLGIEPKWGYKVDKTHLWFFKMNQVKDLLHNTGYGQVKIRGGPFIRYDLPILNHCTWVKRRWWAYRMIDFTIGKLPVLRQLGAIQVFMAEKF